jgi:hypothetical protein
MHRASDKAAETRTIVERISKRNNNEPVEATDLAKELRISKDRAYARIRQAETAKVIQRVNRPEKSNLELSLPTPQPRFIPDPEQFFQKLSELGDKVRFSCAET